MSMTNAWNYLQKPLGKSCVAPGPILVPRVYRLRTRSENGSKLVHLFQQVMAAILWRTAVVPPQYARVFVPFQMLWANFAVNSFESTPEPSGAS